MSLFVRGYDLKIKIVQNMLDLSFQCIVVSKATVSGSPFEGLFWMAFYQVFVENQSTPFHLLHLNFLFVQQTITKDTAGQSAIHLFEYQIWSEGGVDLIADLLIYNWEMITDHIFNIQIKNKTTFQENV